MNEMETMPNLKEFEGKEVIVHTTEKGYDRLGIKVKILKVGNKDLQVVRTRKFGQHFEFQIPIKKLYKITEPTEYAYPCDILWVNKEELDKKKAFVKKSMRNIYHISWTGFIGIFGMLAGYLFFTPRLILLANPNNFIITSFAMLILAEFLYWSLKWNPYDRMISDDYQGYCEVKAGLTRAERRWEEEK